MRDTFRSSALAAIMLLMVTSGNIALAQTATPASWEQGLNGGPSLAVTMQFIQDKMNNQGEIEWVRVQTFPEYTRRDTNLLVLSDVLADPVNCTLHSTEISDQHTVRSGNPASDQRSRMVQTHPFTFKDMDKVTVESEQDIWTRRAVKAGHPENTTTVTPSIFQVSVSGSKAAIPVHLSITRANQAPQVIDQTAKGLAFTFRDEEMANQVANAMRHAIELCGDSQPISGTSSTVAPLKLPATYVSVQAPTDKLQLNADKSFSLQEGGQPYRGTFVANGNTLELSFSESGTKATLSRQGNDLAGSDGHTWSLREQSTGAAPSGAALQNADIVKLVKVGIDDATIIAKIGSSRCQFDTSPDALIQLKKSGVRAAVLKAMVGAGNR